MQVNVRIDRNRLVARREASEFRNAVFVEAQDMLAGTGNGQFIEQFEERGTKFFEEVLGFAFAGLLAGPAVSESVTSK